MFRRTIVFSIALFSAALVLVAVRPNVHADEPDPALSKRALALNDITGQSAIDGEIRKLTKDPASSKKLLKTAAVMVAGKEQPFSYNAAHILAQVARNLKELESARIFYRVCVDEANKLGSTQKVVASYNALLLTLFQLHKDDEAGKLIKEILELPDDEHRLSGLKMEVLQVVASSFVSAGKVDQALKVADNLIKSRPSDWRAYETKLAVLRQAGRYDDAEAVAGIVFDVIKRDTDLKPEEKTEARRKVIVPFLVAGKKEMAVSLAQKLAKDDPTSWKGLELEVLILLKASQAHEAREDAEKALALIDKDSSLDAAKKAQARRDLILAFAQSDQADMALQMAERDAKSHPDDIAAQETKGILLEDAGRAEEAAKVYDRLLQLIAGKEDVDADRKTEIRRNAVLVYVHAGQSQKALQVADKAVAADPTDWDAREIQGMALQELGRTEDATKSYQQMLDLIEKDQKLDDDQRTRMLEAGRYMLSGVYVDANQVDKAAKILQGLLNEHPDNASYNNDLGYIWADHDMHLDQAEKMIRKAVDEDRKKQQQRGGAKPAANAAYLDSLGWVLYKQKKLDEAEKYLQEAVQDKKEGQHVEILDHLADVYMALGQKDKAVSTWKQAIKVAGRTRREKDRKVIVEKKLKDNEK